VRKGKLPRIKENAYKIVMVSISKERWVARSKN
jgi:hypothetical protein